jgi:hypothetical protein
MPEDSRPPRNAGLPRWERRGAALLPLPIFLRRVAFNLALGGLVVAISLLVGMAGYACFENMGWVDSFLNASMILSGMGPADPLHSEGGKIFAGFYALYSGLAVLAVAGLIFAPLLHRLLHHFHADDLDLSQREPDKKAP